MKSDAPHKGKKMLKDNNTCNVSLAMCSVVLVEALLGAFNLTELTESHVKIGHEENFSGLFFPGFHAQTSCSSLFCYCLLCTREWTTGIAQKVEQGKVRVLARLMDFSIL
jgi:hypothetical protein